MYDEEVEHLRDDLENVKSRQAKLEQKVEPMPTKDDHDEIKELIFSIKGDLKGQSQQMTGVDNALKAIQTQVTMLVENEIKGG